ncbi:cell division protein FtsQ/DivIB [Bailinhaonella thermotolerans]|uniref:FtsQ-type POTRA domain-containing protein n=1 Tax=Bailinhaonella thermotolerans TaxID=1070861 RepID=A0A3A4AV84_9ACTN|nr:FtsQ-type POTRA domain-containing protein [Bailinhaonella thermotolerans]RJL31234.1 FtsQ-type POTRA domain-containing protein [Bailinhaonella thermotolerans]
MGRRLKWALGILAVLVPAGAIVWAVCFSDLLAVRAVEVSGLDRLAREEVVRASGVATGTPMVWLDTAEIGRRVAGIRRVEEVGVERRWPGTVRIAVRERTPVLTTRISDRYGLVDRFGVVLEVRQVRPPFPALVVPRLSPESAETRTGLAVIASLPRDFSARVDEIQVPSPEGVRLVLRDGRAVVWGGAERAEEKLRILSRLLGHRGRTFDVSAPEVVSVR